MVGKWFGFERGEVYEEGLSALERGDYEESVRALEACLEAEESNEDVRHYLGRAYEYLASSSMAQEDFAAAGAMAQNALKLNPSFPDLHVLAAKAFLALGARAIAKGHLNRALQLHPSYEEAKTLLEVVEAGGEMNALESSSDVKARAAYILGIADGCMKSELFEEAIASYIQVLRIIPPYPDVHCRLASAYIQTQDLDSAETHLRECLRLNASYVEALMKMSYLHKLRGRDQESQTLLTEAFQIDPLRAREFDSSALYVA